MDKLEEYGIAHGIARNVAFGTLSEGATRPLIVEKDPQIKERAISEMGNR